MATIATGMAADEAQRAASAAKCVCQRSETGESICVCAVPCASFREDKTMEWMCECNLNGKTCQCKFQIQCRRGEKDGPCNEREVYVARCKCENGDCLFQIQKCKCCDIVRTECGVCTGTGQTGVNDGEAKAIPLM